MTLELARVLLDFGLVVLIWMVQLLIYPSFKYYAPKALYKWHNYYTFNMAIVVMPLMFGQLAVYSIQLFKAQTFFNCFGMFVVLSVWVSTFLLFVPLHHKISAGHSSEKTLSLLALRNWIRTFLWTCLFVWSLLDVMY